MYPIDIVGVTKRYGSATAVDDLSFTVTPGRVTGFLGPNGAGKSTLMKILLGLASADSGTALIGGRRYPDLHDPWRTVGAFLEPDVFHPGRTGRNHLRVLADGVGMSGDTIDEILETVGLAGAADRRVGGYSLGMKQRLGLASALLGDPPVLVLDEPGNGLDPAGTRWLRDLLRRHAAAGCTVLVSSHLLSEMEHMADELVVINRGRLITTGATEELRQGGSVVRSPQSEALAGVLEAAGAAVQSQTDGRLIVRGLEVEEIGDHAHRAGVAVHELSAYSSSLEDLFMSWTDDHVAASQIKEEVLV